MNRALRDSAEFDRASHDFVGELLQFLGDLIKQLMQADEVWPFHVPVRLLGVQSKIEHLGELLTEQGNRLAAHIIKKVVLGSEKSGSLKEDVEREAIATLAEESAVTIARGFGSGEELLQCVGTKGIDITDYSRATGWTKARVGFQPTPKPGKFTQVVVGETSELFCKVFFE